MTEFAHLDSLAFLIQLGMADLECQGLISPDEWGEPPARFDGYCARSCRAYKCLLKWPEPKQLAEYPEARIRRQVRSCPEDAHFWLVAGHGLVLDLNFGPVEQRRKECGFANFDYENWDTGERFRRWAEDSRYPQREDARLIMD